MADHWQALIADVAVVSLFISAWMHGHFLFGSAKGVWRHAAFGATMGVGAVASMLLAIQIDGALFDLRSSLIAMAAFFGGPVAALIATGIAVIYRAFVVGGPVTSSAVLSMAVTALIGLVVSRVARGRIPAVITIGVLSVSVAFASLATAWLFILLAGGYFNPLSLPVALMNAAATALSTFFLMRNRVTEREGDLLRQAFLNSPDYQYVKDADSRFVAANLAVARLNGFLSPAGMAGKTDADIAPSERAAVLMADERRLLQTGEPIIDLEEMIPDAFGEKIWYLTSKVALRDENDRIVGLAGVTRDVTVRRRLRDEAEAAKNELDSVLAGVSDGIAMFNRYGVLVYSNEQYCSMFPLTRHLRRRGMHINDILNGVAETGEQKGIPAGTEKEWVEQVAATLDAVGDQQIELFDGRWLQVKTRPTPDGSALVVTSDVTKLKETETQLRATTEQLRLLATTDGLTGLTNRRAFDQALDAELSRARRSGNPLSLLLIDVDRFKRYNDIYGHQAGDEVLKTVAVCLRSALRRPGDTAARYGGEEFVAILPNTDEDGAFFLGDEFREALRALRVPHQGSEQGELTASVGLATLDAEEARTVDAAEFVRRADEALYNAKEAGRDRVMGWRAAHAARLAG